jgi:DNA-binding CsgD family transcriptional regulator
MGVILSRGELDELRRAADAGPGGLDVSTLTPAQRRCAELIAGGESYKGVARALGISTHTVSAHLAAVRLKLGMGARDLRRLASTEAAPC